MHIEVLDKGKPGESRGRKTTDLRDLFLGQRGYRSDHWMQADNNEPAPALAAGLQARWC
jgi:hypothetical protein